MTNCQTHEQCRRRIEQQLALYDFLRERAEAYRRRGANKAAAKLIADIDEARHFDAVALEQNRLDTPEALHALKDWMNSSRGAVILLVQQLGRVHLSLVSRSTSLAVREICGFVLGDPDLDALATLVRHYFNA